MPNNTNPVTSPTISTVAQLDAALSEPSRELIESFASLNGDLMILGAGGKMGPTFARMARRAFDASGKRSRVVAVGRFSNQAVSRELAAEGVEVLAADLSDSDHVRILPHAENILYLVGTKFGTAQGAAKTWVSNTYIAGLVADRYRESRIVALSTGNVYGLVPVDRGRGSTESDTPKPEGEYAMSALGRERVFEHFSIQYGIRTGLIRLNYATELRYGVLVDLAEKVRRGESISLTMGYFNAIWQRDACDMILRTFEHTQNPPRTLNITGIERLSARSVAERFAQLLERTPKFVHAESGTALLSDANRACELLGPPQTSAEQMMQWTADWIQQGGQTWNKPTHFEVRDGKF